MKFLLFDPKQVELSRFAGLPHVYFTGVMSDDEGAVTDPELMVSSLEEIEGVMRERLAKMRAARARDLKEFVLFAAWVKKRAKRKNTSA